MFSKLSNLTGPFSSFSKGTQPRLMLSLDSYSYVPSYSTTFTFDVLNLVTHTSNSVTSTSGGWGNSLATSVETIPLGSPFKLKFRRGETLGNIMCGVSQNPPIDSYVPYSKLSFGFYVGSSSGDANSLSVVEAGNFNIGLTHSVGAYPSSTIYTIIYDGTSVKYYVNDGLFHTSTSVPNDDLFLYIIFNESGRSITDIEFGSYTIWNDLSGNSRNFNLINFPNYVNDSFYFNGDGQYATGSDLGTLKKFTVDTWFNLKSLPSTDNNPQIITNIYSNYINFSIGFLNGTSVMGNPWNQQISGGFFPGQPWRHTSGFTPSVDTWYNVALTYDTKYLTLYLNGNVFSSVETSISASSSGSGIYLGRRWDFGQYIDGDIDVVKIWDGPLTSTQILNNYNSISPRYLTTDSSVVLQGRPGNPKWLEIPKSIDFSLSDTYTIEFWSKAATSSNTIDPTRSIFTIACQQPGDNNIDVFYISGKLNVRNNLEVCNEPTPGIWTHVAIVSNSGSLKVYYDGVSVYSGVGLSFNDNGNNLAIGRRGPSNDFQYFDGEIYGFRINNTAVYTSGFNPYSSALPMVSIPGTVLLVDKYKPSINTFIDSSRRHNITNHGVTYSSDIPSITGRYIRWLITKTVGPDGSNAVQVGDLVLLNNGSTASWNNSATVTNPDGTFSIYETPPNLLDYNSHTKWCDTNFGSSGVGTSSIYIDNITPITFDSYYYVTANDYPERSPITWTLAISDDNSNWRVVDRQTDVGITSSTYTNTQIFTIN